MTEIDAVTMRAASMLERIDCLEVVVSHAHDLIRMTDGVGELRLCRDDQPRPGFVTYPTSALREALAALDAQEKVDGGMP